MLTELPYIGKEYSVSFEVFINKMPTQPYQSVIHFTTGDNNSRNPAVWVTANKEFCFSGNNKLWKKLPGLEENKWYKIEINQKLVVGKVINLNLEFELIKHILVHVQYYFGWCRCIFRRKYRTCLIWKSEGDGRRWLVWACRRTDKKSWHQVRRSVKFINPRKLKSIDLL